MTQFDLAGLAVSGLGEGAGFTGLAWADTQFRAKLGFAPFPGTFNLLMDGDEWRAARSLLRREAGIRIDPPAGFCAAKCFPVTVADTLRCAAVIPDVASYPDDKLEILAPVSLRARLGVRDGERVRVRLALD